MAKHIGEHHYYSRSSHSYCRLMVYIIVVLGIFACSLSQLLLKSSANHPHKSRIYEIVNPWVIVAYMIIFVALLINIWAMGRGLQLKEIAVLESLGYIFVPLLSYLFLSEDITPKTIVAVIIIIIGLIIFYL